MFPQSLDRHSAIPLYFQIQQHLSEQIRSGKLRPADTIPSEQEIASRLRVSRMTARQALKYMCNLGLVYTRRGKGTFVSGVKLEKNFRQVLSFSEEMRERGNRASSKVVYFKMIRADAELAEALQIGLDEQVVSLCRIRLANSQPMAIEESHLALRFVPNLMKSFNPRNSLYQALSDKYGIQVMFADEIAEAGLARTRECKLLRVTIGSPVLYFRRIAFAQNGRPIEYVKAAYRGDRYKLVNRLTRPVGGTLRHKS